MPVAYSLVRTPAPAGFALRPSDLDAGVLFHRWVRSARLHLPVACPAPRMRASDAWQTSSSSRLTLLLVRPFAPGWQLLWPLLTSRSVFPRRPFRHEARSPRVRTHSFTAQPPDLRHLALTTRALRLLARSPCSAAPHIRFLFIGSRFTLYASSPRSVALPQLRFASFAVASLREDLHLQECARAGRTKKASRGGQTGYRLSAGQSVADHPGPHGGEHFLPVGGVEQHRLARFGRATATTAAVLFVVLPAVGG